MQEADQGTDHGALSAGAAEQRWARARLKQEEAKQARLEQEEAERDFNTHFSDLDSLSASMTERTRLMRQSYIERWGLPPEAQSDDLNTLMSARTWLHERERAMHESFQRAAENAETRRLAKRLKQQQAEKAEKAQQAELANALAAEAEVERQLWEAHLSNCSTGPLHQAGFHPRGAAESPAEVGADATAKMEPQKHCVSIGDGRAREEFRPAAMWSLGFAGAVSSVSATGSFPVCGSVFAQPLPVNPPTDNQTTGSVRQKRAWPDGQDVGLLIGSFALGSAVGSYVAGLCCDRWGRRPVLLYGLACIALFTTIFGAFCTQLSETIVARFFLGVSAAMVVVPVKTAVTEIGVHSNHRAVQSAGIVIGLSSAAKLAGPATAALLSAL